MSVVFLFLLLAQIVLTLFSSFVFLWVESQLPSDIVKIPASVPKALPSNIFPQNYAFTLESPVSPNLATNAVLATVSDGSDSNLANSGMPAAAPIIKTEIKELDSDVPSQGPQESNIRNNEPSSAGIGQLPPVLPVLEIPMIDGFNPDSIFLPSPVEVPPPPPPQNLETIVIPEPEPTTAVPSVPQIPRVLTYPEFKSFISAQSPSTGNASSKVIPKYLFRIGPFELNELPVQFRTLMETTAINNPGYTPVYFSHREMDDFVVENFPQHSPGYHSVVPGAYKADIFRILLLSKYGGIYNDLPQTYMQSIPSIVRDTDEFVSVVDFSPDYSTLGSKSIAQGFIAAYPSHPLIELTTQVIMNNVNSHNYGVGCLDITGPRAVGRAFNRFLGRSDDIPLERGTYSHNGYTFQMLYYDVREDETQNFFIDQGGNRLIQAKFPGSGTLLYTNRQQPYYAEVWVNKQVFGEPYPTPPEPQQPNPAQQQVVGQQAPQFQPVQQPQSDTSSMVSPDIAQTLSNFWKNFAGFGFFVDITSQRKALHEIPIHPAFYKYEVNQPVLKFKQVSREFEW